MLRFHFTEFRYLLNLFGNFPTLVQLVPCVDHCSYFTVPLWESWSCWTVRKYCKRFMCNFLIFHTIVYMPFSYFYLPRFAAINISIIRAIFFWYVVLMLLRLAFVYNQCVLCTDVLAICNLKDYNNVSNSGGKVPSNISFDHRVNLMAPDSHHPAIEFSTTLTCSLMSYLQR